MAYIIENDIILYAIHKELDRLGETVHLQNDSKISAIQLGSSSGSMVQLKSGQCYSCDLLVSFHITFKFLFNLFFIT